LSPNAAKSLAATMFLSHQHSIHIELYIFLVSEPEELHRQNRIATDIGLCYIVYELQCTILLCEHESDMRSALWFVPNNLGYV
ncbi:MAG: hypothetical protein KBG83_06590, partial [Bacteroidetes bacterium]|nr:hypothetical protein [Bacteroidota bacterium]